ncbi:hypothetical protein [Mycolicibacterium sp. XJ1819]
MGLKEYDVVDPHTGRETTLQLSDEDAQRMGLTGKDAEAQSKAKTPANKSRTAATKRAEAESQAFGAKK